VVAVVVKSKLQTSFYDWMWSQISTS